MSATGSAGLEGIGAEGPLASSATSHGRTRPAPAWLCEHCGETNDRDRDGDKCGFCNQFRLRRLYEDLAGG